MIDSFTQGLLTNKFLSAQNVVSKDTWKKWEAAYFSN